MAGYLAPLFNAFAKPSRTQASDGAFSHQEVQEEAEIRNKRRKKNPGEGGSRRMACQDHAENDARDDEKLKCGSRAAHELRQRKFEKRHVS